MEFVTARGRWSFYQGLTIVAVRGEKVQPLPPFTLARCGPQAMTGTAPSKSGCQWVKANTSHHPRMVRVNFLIQTMKQKIYRVRWEIDIPAESPEEAAKVALRIHRDPRSTATIFDICECSTERRGDWVRIDVPVAEIPDPVKPTVVIGIEGGLINEVISTTDINAVLIDRDTGCGDQDQLRMIPNRDGSYSEAHYTDILDVEVNPERAIQLLGFVGSTP